MVAWANKSYMRRAKPTVLNTDKKRKSFYRGWVENKNQIQYNIPPVSEKLYSASEIQEA